jgi:hypothetical protein
VPPGASARGDGWALEVDGAGPKVVPVARGVGRQRCDRKLTRRRKRVAGSDDRRGIAGISLGGIIVIVGIVLMFVWSLWIGLIIVLIGLIAFGGFARGKWY